MHHDCTEVNGHCSAGGHCLARLPVTPMQSGVRSIARNTAYLSSTRAITSISRAVYAILLAAMLGPELYGMFNYVLSWSLLLLPVAVLGLDLILIREIGRGRENSHQLVGQTFTLRLFAGTLVAAAFICAGFMLESDSRVLLLYIVLAFALIGRSLALWVNAILKGHEVADRIFWLESGFRLGEVLVGALILYLGGGLLGVALVHALSWVVQAMAGFWLLHRKVIALSIAWHRASVLELLGKGAPFVVAAFLGVWMLQGGVFYVRWFEGFSADLGNYMLAMQAFLIIGGVAAELGQAALPALSRSIDRGDGKEAYFIDVILRIGILAGGFLALVAQLSGAQLIGWLFDQSYSMSGVLLPWALLIVCNYFLYVNLNSVLIASGRFLQVVVVAASGALVFSLLAPVLFQTHQLAGIIWATGGGMLSANGLQLLFLSRRSRVSLGRSLLAPLLVVVAGWATTLMVTAWWLMFQLVMVTAVLVVMALVLRVIPATAWRQTLSYLKGP
jgi:O-antigen/teichoic acid export membrane protein